MNIAGAGPTTEMAKLLIKQNGRETQFSDGSLDRLHQNARNSLPCRTSLEITY